MEECTPAERHALELSSRSYGTVLVGTKIYMAPANQNTVGVFDTSTHTFSTVATDLPSGGEKYIMGTKIGTTVYFAPANIADVGVLDTTTNSWFRIATGLGGSWRYFGAVSYGTRVFFAPCHQTAIGVVETTTSTFSTIASGLSAGGWMYVGGFTVGPLIYFVPDAKTEFLVLDTTTGTTSTRYLGKGFFGHVQVGSKVYMPPSDHGGGGHNVIGVFDVSTLEFNTINTGITQPYYIGGAASGLEVYFAPFDVKTAGVGVLPALQVICTS